MIYAVTIFLSSFLLFLVQPLDYLANPAFGWKMALLAVATANAAAFVLGGLERRPGSGPARILALVSLLLWPTVLLCGRFIGFLA